MTHPQHFAVVGRRLAPTCKPSSQCPCDPIQLASMTEPDIVAFVHRGRPMSRIYQAGVTGQVVEPSKDRGAGVRGSLRPCRGRGPETAPIPPPSRPA
jgi:hypothetical protein